MSTYKIRIPITPKAKGSWRIGRYCRYNPSLKGMSITTKFVEQRLNGQPLPLLHGPLLVIVHFRIPIAKARPQKYRVPQHNKPHIKKPDGDNLEKFLNDALNGIIWADDASIAWLLRSKSLTKEKVGETILFVRELGEGVSDYVAILNDIREHIDYDLGQCA